MALDKQKGTTLGIVTTSSETAFSHAPETIYDFVTNPANWTKTYPGGPQIRHLPDELPLKVGDTWDEAHPDPERTASSRGSLAIAMRPSLFVFNSLGRLGHDSAGIGGLEGRMTIYYHFTQPTEGHALHALNDD